MAAIETLNDYESRTYTCTGSTEIGGQTITCPSAHGDMDIYGALANSCNCFYAQLAVEMGGKTMWQYAKKAGLLDSLSVSGISTAAGSFTAAAEGSADLGWSGVGQYNDLVNPCAMMTLCGTIANRGTQVPPRLLLKETTAAGLRIGHSRAEKHSGTLSSDTCALLASMMRRNVTEHYGQSSFGQLGRVRQVRHRRGGQRCASSLLVHRFRRRCGPPPGFCCGGGKRRQRRIRGRQCRSQSTDCSCRSRLLSRNNGCCISLQAAIVPFLLFPIQNFFEILWFFLSFSLVTG